MSWRSAAICLLGFSVLTGCNGGPSTSTTSTSTTTSAGAPTGAKVSVVYIPKNSGNPYFDNVDAGFKDAATQFNLDYTMVAPATADATSQVPTITDQIQRGVNVIAISPNSPDALNSVLDQAKAKGIVVITVDSDLVGNESHRDAAITPVEVQDVGVDQIKLLSQLMGGQGDFAILSATTDSPNQNAWIATIKNELKKPEYAKLKLVDTVYGDDEPQKSTTECEGLLAKYPNLKGILSPTSVGLAASAQVLERSGKFPGGPKVTGTGIQLTGLSTPNQLKKFVKNGVVTSFQLWEPRKEGVVAAYVGQQIFSKKLTPKAAATVDVPSLGKRTFTPKLELAGGDMLTFDKTNIDKYDF